MTKRKDFRVLVATDGSAAAKAAASTAASFPWPESVQVSGVMAEQMYAAFGASLPGPNSSEQVIADKAIRPLALRWPDVRARVIKGPAIDAILGEAKRVGADVIVLGWRGHGAVRRVISGSVSRGIVRGASCAVLVVRRAAHDVRNVVLGFDGSAHAHRAVALLARLSPPRGGRVALVSAAETTGDVPAHALIPSRIRAKVAAEGRRINKDRVELARRALERPALTLASAGWKVDPTVTNGPPLEDLLAAVRDTGARLLVVGARGKGNVEHLLVGSVAQGAMDRSSVPILIAR